jgi:dihydrofolate reductase
MTNTPTPFTITIHMVASLDGFIAKPDNSVGWFETVDTYEKGVTGQDAAEFLKTIDCYVMGARTYEHALALSKTYGWAYGDTPTIVLSHRKLPIERSNVEICSADLGHLVEQQLKPKYKNVWVVGGAQLAKDFIRSRLANDIRMTILPILLGEGLPFFAQLQGDQPLHLKDVTAYRNGMVELWYEIKK